MGLTRAKAMKRRRVCLVLRYLLITPALLFITIGLGTPKFFSIDVATRPVPPSGSEAKSTDPIFVKVHPVNVSACYLGGPTFSTMKFIEEMSALGLGLQGASYSSITQTFSASFNSMTDAERADTMQRINEHTKTIDGLVFQFEASNSETHAGSTNAQPTFIAFQGDTGLFETCLTVKRSMMDKIVHLPLTVKMCFQNEDFCDMAKKNFSMSTILSTMGISSGTTSTLTWSTMEQHCEKMSSSKSLGIVATSFTCIAVIIMASQQVLTSPKVLFGLEALAHFLVVACGGASVSTLLSALYGYSKDLDKGFDQQVHSMDMKIGYSYGSSSILIALACTLHSIALVFTVLTYAITKTITPVAPQVSYAKMGMEDEDGEDWLSTNGSPTPSSGPQRKQATIRNASSLNESLTA